MKTQLSRVFVLMVGMSGLASLGCSNGAPTAATKPPQNDVIKVPNGMPGSDNPKAKVSSGKLAPGMMPGKR